MNQFSKIIVELFVNIYQIFLETNCKNTLSLEALEILKLIYFLKNILEKNCVIQKLELIMNILKLYSAYH